MSNNNGSAVISSYAYGYYASGNQRTETDHEGVVTTYTYDGLGRLTQESSSEGKVYAYTYDANSNRATMVVTNTINGETITIESVTYTYDANNRLTTEATTLIGSVETTRYTYDHNGNMLSNMVYSSTDTVIKSLVYTYDGFNRQASVSANSGTVTAHYTYNGHGIRNSKTLGITTTEFLLDGGAVVGEQIGSGVDTYLRGSNLISANGDTYYLFNGHGDVVDLSNTSGNSTKTYEYDAFGVEQNIDELDDNPFRYCGEYFDRETGTYYLRARYYDPKRGRFTQEDTLALNVFTCSPQILLIAQVGNKYVYCANNPVMYSDPSGRKVDLSPDPRQAAIDDGGTAPADDPSTGGGSTGTGGSSPDGENANTGNDGGDGTESGKPDLPALPSDAGDSNTEDDFAPTTADEQTTILDIEVLINYANTVAGFDVGTFSYEQCLSVPIIPEHKNAFIEPYIEVTIKDAPISCTDLSKFVEAEIGIAMNLGKDKITYSYDGKFQAVAFHNETTSIGCIFNATHIGFSITKSEDLGGVIASESWEVAVPYSVITQLGGSMTITSGGGGGGGARTRRSALEFQFGYNF